MNKFSSHFFKIFAVRKISSGGFKVVDYHEHQLSGLKKAHIFVFYLGKMFYSTKYCQICDQRPKNLHIQIHTNIQSQSLSIINYFGKRIERFEFTRVNFSIISIINIIYIISLKNLKEKLFLFSISYFFLAANKQSAKCLSEIPS